MGPVFPSKWPKLKCPACSEPWNVDDPLAYNDDGVVVHAECAAKGTPTTEVYKGAKIPVCSKCNLTHPTTYDCDE
jgi:hypothetical protein